MKNEPLWERIAAYPLPADGAGLSFVEQLRKDQRISEKTARRGIEEYRRFLYLSATDDARTVPTKAVDAVWHLHLTHTRDYWERFVPDVLDGKPIHHAPGALAGQSADFAVTLRRYEAEFGEAPPKGIWRHRSVLSRIVAAVFALVWTVMWVAGSLAAGLPIFAFVGLAFGGLFIMASVSEFVPGLSIGIDIWSDSDGGDCSDGDGGGCGD